MIPPRISQIKSAASKKAAGGSAAAVANNLRRPNRCHQPAPGRLSVLGWAHFATTVSSDSKGYPGKRTAQDALNQARMPRIKQATGNQ